MIDSCNLWSKRSTTEPPRLDQRRDFCPVHIKKFSWSIYNGMPWQILPFLPIKKLLILIKKISLVCGFKVRPTLMQQFYETALNGRYLNLFETRLLEFNKSFLNQSTLYEFTSNSYCHLDYNRTKCKLRYKSQIVKFQLFFVDEIFGISFYTKNGQPSNRGYFKETYFSIYRVLLYIPM